MSPIRYICASLYGAAFHLVVRLDALEQVRVSPQHRAELLYRYNMRMKEYRIILHVTKIITSRSQDNTKRKTYLQRTGECHKS